MTRAGQIQAAKWKLDPIAWNFLGSEFTAQIYADWPIDRRVDAYLRHHGLIDIVSDGGAYNALLGTHHGQHRSRTPRWPTPSGAQIGSNAEARVMVSTPDGMIWGAKTSTSLALKPSWRPLTHLRDRLQITLASHGA